MPLYVPPSVSGPAGPHTHVKADVTDFAHGHAQIDITNLVNDLAGKAASVHSHPQSDVTGLVAALAGKAASIHGHAISDVTSLQTTLDGKALASHAHTIADVTNLQTTLNGKAASVHTHAQADVTNLVTDLAGKAAAVHGHSIGETTGLQTALDGKAATVHTHAAVDLASGTVATARLGSGTANSGTFLRGDQTWAAPPGGAGAWTVVKATTPETRTANANLAADAALVIPLNAATLYHVRGFVLFTTANATMDYKYDLNYTGTITSIFCKRAHANAGATAGTDNENTIAQASILGSTAVAATTSGVAYVELNAVITTNASGTLQFRWAQNTSDPGALTRLAGSYLEYASF